MARHCVALCGALYSFHMRVDIDRYFPELARAAREVWATVENHATMLSVALRSATLSHRGSLGKAHCVIVWVCKLGKLKTEWHLEDASLVIRSYNSQASSVGQLLGQRRTSVLALLNASPERSHVCFRLLANAHPKEHLGTTIHGPTKNLAWIHHSLL